ncbi:MAG: hypothetical protein LBI18_01445 [Planctomycetaceae bacterium]|jgi:hypothetical protein|nr:hypothetical protein [Planctomycetaceae bacterium]
MGFLKQFYRNMIGDNSPIMAHRNFEQLPKLEIESHLSTSTYGDFILTKAIRPSFDLRVVPEQGYRHDCYWDDWTQTSIPVILVSVSAEQLFETFLDLLDPLGDTVDVVLETSHRRNGDSHTDLYREAMDLPILKSFLYDFEEMLLNDGCTGIAVLNPSIPVEVQFDEHKMLIIYARNQRTFQSILQQHRIPNNETIRFLTETEHIHSTRSEYWQRFHELQFTLGIDDECPLIL